MPKDAVNRAEPDFYKNYYTASARYEQ